MLAQDGALNDLVQQHLRAKGKIGVLRLNKFKIPVKKSSTNNANGSTTNGTATANERSPKTVKRRRSGKGNGRKKARKKK